MLFQRDTGMPRRLPFTHSLGTLCLSHFGSAVKFLLRYVMTQCAIELEYPSGFANPNTSASVAHAERHVSFETRLVKMLHEGIEKYDLERRVEL